ncbi:hypothetical protein HZH68_007469 [Vespula germanica]|uniref:Uncharacterized protein n=2 Tax=Vespula TaxID=7451 RepID=A0A834K6Z9_VESGE|nr:hypothetical protein HZH68_007469 [Vespula germanica]
MDVRVLPSKYFRRFIDEFADAYGFVRFTCNAELVTLAQTATGNELPRDERVRPTPTTLTGVLVPVVAGVIACLSARLNYVSACPAAGARATRRHATYSLHPLLSFLFLWRSPQYFSSSHVNVHALSGFT